MMNDDETPGYDLKADVPHDHKGRHHDVFEDVAAVAQLLTQTGILSAISERVRFARARMGTDDVIDVVVVLIGYALSGEPAVQAFYERLLPFAEVFGERRASAHAVPRRDL